MTDTLANELPWIAEARKHIGLKEIVGPQHNKTIQSWLKELGSAWTDDETPWCGTFVAHCLKTAGRRIPQYWARAKAYTEAGKQIARPAYGSIVVFTRDGGGHVGFVIGRDAAGNLMVLGGNQSNMVNVKPFSLARVVGYFWPSTDASNREEPADFRYNLPLLQSDGKLSTNEA
jgi:TIGR02594 family protein|nr:MAG TPA: Tail associated lysozyme [Caudoviricetes sp.]